MTATKSIGYVRVSTDEQEISPEVQREKVTTYARLYGLEMVGVIEDRGVSGATLKRPGLQYALTCLERGDAEALVVAKLDRLTRSVHDLGRLISGPFAKAQLLSVGEQIDTRTAAGRLMLHVLASVSQWERETIAERTSAALQHKIARGELVGRPPYGTRAVDGMLVEVPHEQECIAVARVLRDSGLSLQATCEELARRGYRDRQGDEFQKEQVRRMTDPRRSDVFRRRREEADA